MLAQLDVCFVVLSAVKWTLATGPSSLQRSVMGPANSVSRKGGKTVLIMKQTLWKNNLNFGKDMSMIYVNLIIIVIIVSEK